MSPQTVGAFVLRDVKCLQADVTVGDAVHAVRDSDLPALPVLDGEKLLGVFGEREFIGALFPGYLGELGSAAYVPRAIEAVIDKRSACRHEPIRQHVTTDHVDVDTGFSDVQLAEIFLHHRVLIVPVLEERRVVGVITRADFFAALVDRFDAGA